MAIITQSTGNEVIIEEYNYARNLIDTSGKLKSGYTPAEYDALVYVITQKITDALSQLSAAVITGATEDNTDNGTLYFEISVSGSDNVLEVFKDSGRAAGDLVANSTDTLKAGGALTLTAQNGSGLGGTVTSIAAAVAEAASSVEFIEEIDRYDGDVSSQVSAGIAMHYDSTNASIEAIPRCKALIDGVGSDNVDGIFTKRAMIAFYQQAGIDLV